MRVLVTGGGGFLGSHIINQLLDKGHEIVQVSRGDYPELHAKGVTCYRADLSDRLQLEKVLSPENEKEIYNGNISVVDEIFKDGHILTETVEALVPKIDKDIIAKKLEELTSKEN